MKETEDNNNEVIMPKFYMRCGIIDNKYKLSDLKYTLIGGSLRVKEVFSHEPYNPVVA